MIKKIYIFIILVFSFVGTGFANIPEQYRENYYMQEDWESMIDLFVKIRSKENVGDDIPESYFQDLNESFQQVFEYLPSASRNKMIYNQCLSTTRKLANGYTQAKYIIYKERCFDPLGQIINEIESSRTVQANITANPSSGSAPLVVTFDARNSSDPSETTIPTSNFFWHFRDSDGNEQAMGRGPIIDYEFDEPGNYVVHLTVRSVNNMMEGVFDGTDKVSINVEPQAAILAAYINSERLNTDSAVKISTNQAQDGIVINAGGTRPTGGRQIMEYELSIQGEGYSAEEDGEGEPGSYRFRLPGAGKYNVTLEIQDNQNNTTSETYELVVSDPIANARITPEDGTTSSTYEFESAKSYSVESTINTYQWTLYNPEGNQIEVNQTPTFSKTFDTPGYYTAELQVTDQMGEVSLDQEKFYVDSTSPKANFTIDPVRKWEKPSQFIFDAGVSQNKDSTSDGLGLEYDWDLGAGQGEASIEMSVKDGEQIIASFEEKGKYDVTLTVRNEYGKIHERTRTIEVESSVRPDLTVDPIATYWGNPIEMSVSTNKSVSFYEWDFGDGETREMQDKNTVSYEYDSSGIYDVKVRAHTPSGENNMVSKRIFLGDKDSPIPVYIVQLEDDTILMPESTCKTNGSTRSAYVVDRYEEIIIDASDSLDASGRKGNVDIYFDPENLGRTKTNTLEHNFGQMGCQSIEILVEDSSEDKTSRQTVWFDVQNAEPELENLSMSFPQYGGETQQGLNNQVGVDDTGNDERFNRWEYNPILIRMSADGAEDPDGRISRYVWYYYRTSDPTNPLETKVTPPDIDTTVFSVPKIGGEYSFGVRLVDNDGVSLDSREILGADPSIFIPDDDGSNPDIPVVNALIVSKSTLDVGEEVEFEVDTEVLSNRQDFEKMRVFKFDFDGDGIWDKTTRENKVSHIYKKTGTYSPQVMVSYRDYNAYGSSQEVRVRQGLNPQIMYDKYKNISIFRDVSYGNIAKSIFYPDYYKARKLQSNNQSVDDITKTNKEYFKHEYDKPGEYLALLELQGEYGDKDGHRETIVVDEELDQEDSSKQPVVLSLPNLKEKKSIDIGKNLNNEVVFYVYYEGEGSCFVDSDITIDSDGDGQPSKDKDFECNELIKRTYEPSALSTITRVYYGQEDNLENKDIEINFMDVDLNLSQEDKELYNRLTDILNEISHINEKDIQHLRTLLLDLRNNINDSVQVDGLLLQINDIIDQNLELDKQLRDDINDIINELEGGASMAAMGGNRYEIAKQEILAYVPSSIRDFYEEQFRKIENANGQQVKIKDNLEEMLDTTKNHLDQGRIDQIDLQIIEDNVCEILDYYGIGSTFCERDENQNDDQEEIVDVDGESDGILNNAFKIVLGIFIMLLVVFVILVIVFAIKAKKEQDQQTNEEYE